MASRLTLIRKTWKVIAERSNYTGTEMIAKSPETGDFYFMRFAYNGNEVFATSEGYKRIRSVIKALYLDYRLIQSFASKKNLNHAYEFFKNVKA